MPIVDMPLAELRAYRPQRSEPADFDEFWSTTLADTRRYELAPRFEPVDSGLRLIDVYDVSFSDAGEQIKAWLAVPAGAGGPLPCVVEAPGYGGGRGLPHDLLLYAAAGYAHLFMDVRGQGSSWRPGDTPDRESDGGNPQHPGFMTRGILDPATYYYYYYYYYYYRRVIADAVRAVETARSHEAVDATRVAFTGGSQGAGITLMVSGLVPDLVAVLPDVPFLCDYRRCLDVAVNDPYREIERYLKVHRDRVDQAFTTLSYFDGLNFAVRAGAPALFSVGLLDITCPPSTVFAAYNHYAVPKSIEVYEFNGHEGGESFHAGARVRFPHEAFGRSA
jgi:cephalosporin-C deacetylase